MMRKDDVLRRTGTDWVVEGVTIACVVAILVSFGFYGHIDADEAFPMHYNAAGEVDGWGTRSALWIFGGVALAVCLLLTIGERFYKKFNYPVRVTEKNREWLWRLAVRMFRGGENGHHVVFHIHSICGDLGRLGAWRRHWQAHVDGVHGGPLCRGFRFCREDVCHQERRRGLSDRGSIYLGGRIPLKQAMRRF